MVTKGVERLIRENDQLVSRVMEHFETGSGDQLGYTIVEIETNTSKNPLVVYMGPRSYMEPIRIGDLEGCPSKAYFPGSFDENWTAVQLAAELMSDFEHRHNIFYTGFFHRNKGSEHG